MMDYLLEASHNITFVIDGQEFKGTHGEKKGTITIFCDTKNLPNLRDGMEISEKHGNTENRLVVTKCLNIRDLNLLGVAPGKSLVDFSYITEAEHRRLEKAIQPMQVNNYNNSAPVFTGDNTSISDSFNGNITVEKLIEHVKNHGDDEAKSSLKALLNNSTVGSLLGVGASTLISQLFT